MPFPLEKKYIEETEKELGLFFPKSFADKMMRENGGELSTEDDDWQLVPFFDKSDKKRISRTCNPIALETKTAREWPSFPKDLVVIGLNGLGDFLVLKTNPSDSKKLLETIFTWRHETGDLEKVADSIQDL